MVHFDDSEWNRFPLHVRGIGCLCTLGFPQRLTSSVRQFKVLKVDKTMLDYYTKLSDFHAQFRCHRHELQSGRQGAAACYFSEKKAMALLYKLEQVHH